MALIVLTSASGAPGVSTSCLGLALAWPRKALLVEADPSAGSDVLAGWFNGSPPHDRGLVNLAMAMSYTSGHTPPEQWLPAALSDVVVSIPGSAVDVVTGIRTPAQAGALAPLWSAFAATAGTLADGGVDLIVDAGRLGMAHAPTPLVQAADLALLTVGSDLPVVATARGWSRELRARFADVGMTEHLALLLVGPGRPYRSREVADLLGLPLAGVLPWDPRTAQALRLGQNGKRLVRSPLVSALRGAASAITELAENNRARLSSTATPAHRSESHRIDGHRADAHRADQHRRRSTPGRWPG